MTYGLYCLCANGMVVDTTTITGVLQEALSLSTGSSGTLSYPSLAGRTIFIQTTRAVTASGGIFNNRSLRFDISYTAGYPIVTYSPVGSGGNYMLNVYVMVK